MSYELELLEAELAEKIKQDLVGTCMNSLEQSYEYFTTEYPQYKVCNIDKIEELLSHEVYTCEGCGWIVDISDIDEDGYCSDCHIEEEDFQT